MLASVAEKCITPKCEQDWKLIPRESKDWMAREEGAVFFSGCVVVGEMNGLNIMFGTNSTVLIVKHA